MTSRRVTSSCSRPSSTASRRIRDSSSSIDLGLYSPILGRHFRIPSFYNELPVIELDDTLPYVPVYCHFTIPDIEPVVRPPTPPILKELRAEL
ncbi:WD repeat-containing protein on Y chromosome [Copidosoma floridanum]|uniref:WD repeat-containing protein on Y chromosome n=1 Tax=Copidosoma floridanum TaxID=29053 RepID=UPI000C6F8A54|nr:WD repeat-containing protein on Y chromosome [Copidosoma floridanum]